MYTRSSWTCTGISHGGRNRCPTYLNYYSSWICTLRNCDLMVSLLTCVIMWINLTYIKQVGDPVIDIHEGMLHRRYSFDSYYNCNLTANRTQADFFPRKVYVIATPGLTITKSHYKGGATWRHIGNVTQLGGVTSPRRPSGHKAGLCYSYKVLPPNRVYVIAANLHNPCFVDNCQFFIYVYVCVNIV